MNAPRRNSQRGHAILEFALGFAVLWALFSGIYQFGYSFYVYNMLMTSVANAAELSSKLDYDLGDPASYQTKLKNMVVYGSVTAGTKPLVQGLTTANVNVAIALDTQTMPHDVTISITGYTIDSIFQSFTLTNKPRATVKYLGIITCSTC